MADDFLILNDISYGSRDRQKVDIFIPKKTVTSSGIILFIHGGGWHSGDKKAHYDDARHFCSNGYICASMNYRFVSDSVSVFEELDDITSALRTIKLTCAQHGFEVKILILSGASAGAHLSLLYAYTRSCEAPLLPVAACVYCPPVNCAGDDFLFGISDEFDEWKYDLLSKCCGFKVTKSDFLNEPQQTALKRISPQTYVSKNCVPTAVFHGKHDDLIPLGHIRHFIGLLDKVGVKNDFLLYENSGHILNNDESKALQCKEIIKNYAELYLTD